MTRRRHLWLLALFLVVFLGWQSTNIEVFELDYDEGVYLAEAALVQQGHSLYSEVKSPSPPLFIWGLAASFVVAGAPSVEAARLAILLSSGVGLLALAVIARRLAPGAGGWAALLAAILLALFPLWFLYARVAMADVPSLSLTLVAVALALQSWRDERRFWLSLAGVSAALALLVKAQAAYAAPLLALVVVLRPRPSEPWPAWAREVLRAGFVTLGGFLVPIVLVLPFLDLGAAYELVFRYHWEAARQWVDPARALLTIASFLSDHLGWLLLAGAGLAWLARRRAWRSPALLGGWFLLVVALLAQHAPLSGHLLLPLVPPLAVAGGIALDETLASFRVRSGRVAMAGGPAPTGSGPPPGGVEAALSRRNGHAAPRTTRRRRTETLALSASTVAVLLAAVLLWPFAWRQDVGQILPPWGMPLLNNVIVPWLAATVPAEETVITDEPMAVFRANRAVPPSLTDTSFKKINSGFLTAQEVIATAERERPAVIMFWRDRLIGLRPWRAWVERHYVAACRYSPRHVIYVRPDLAQRPSPCEGH